MTGLLCGFDEKGCRYVETLHVARKKGAGTSKHCMSPGKSPDDDNNTTSNSSNNNDDDDNKLN
jgi:hypothetical protein